MTTPITAPDWNCLTPHAPWQERDSQGYVVFQNQMWILGGWFTPSVPNPRDVWSSTDGIHWTCAADTAPWEFSDLPVTLDFKDRLWLMGGRKLPGAENSNAVWSSPDGVSWNMECRAAGWCPRVSAAHTVFQGKMWVLGGSENFYQDIPGLLHNDVWCSEDGINWTCVLENAPWPARAHHRAVVFDNHLWILGGGARFPDPQTRNDVWRSPDGVNWTRVMESAEWGPRLWHSVVVYRDHLWVLAGWSEITDNYGDVWCSPDGIRWSEIKSETIWSPRHAQAAFVLNEKLYFAAGHARPVSNEVWSLDLPPDTLH